MGIISNLHDNIKARIEEKTSKIKEKREEAAKKRLAAKRGSRYLSSFRRIYCASNKKITKG